MAIWRLDNDHDGNFTDVTDEHYYILSDVQFSTVAVIDDVGMLAERITYDPYGKARHHHYADVDGDGDYGSDDQTAITNLNNTAITSANYNVDCDVDRSGTINSTDRTLAGSTTAAIASGLISNSTVENVVGYDGYLFMQEASAYHVRFRWYDPEQGRWWGRDPVGYADSRSLFEYSLSAPSHYSDYSGLTPCKCECKDDQIDLANTINKQVGDFLKNTHRPEHVAYQFVQHDKDFKGPCYLTYIEILLETNFAGKEHEGHPILTGGEDSDALNSVNRAAYGASYPLNLGGYAPCAKVCGVCIGLDKLGHFFEEGFLYYQIAKLKSKEHARALGAYLEGVGSTITDKDILKWLSDLELDAVAPCGKFRGKAWAQYGHHGDIILKSNNGKPVSPADLEANEGGMQFFFDLEVQGKDYMFDICKYINKKWDENQNPNVASDPQPEKPQ